MDQRVGCVFCGKPTEVETMMAEHFVPITAEGTSLMANLSLAYKECNAAVTDLSVREKVERTVRNRRAPARDAERSPTDATHLDPAS